MECREQLPVLIESHPYYKSLNKKIMDESIEYPFVDSTEVLNRDGGISNLRAFKTQSKLDSKSFEVFYGWMLSLLRDQYPGWKFRVTDTWLGKYNKGHHAYSHNHSPAFMSFVYFIKCPKGSSPLVFTTSGKRVKAEDGKLVMFPGYLKHHVPKNKCDGRIVLAGNIFTIF